MSKTIKAVALALALLMACFMFAACGGRGSNINSSNIHELINNNGVSLITDDAINTNDTGAQEKIDEYLSDGNAEQIKPSFVNDQMSVDIFAKGNAIVMEFYITVELSDEQKAIVKENLPPKMKSINVNDGRNETGVENLVVVYALFDRNNELIMSEILK